MAASERVQIIIEEGVTDIVAQTSPIIVNTDLAVRGYGAGNYLLSDLDTYKTGGFLQFMSDRPIRFEEVSTSDLFGNSAGVFLNLGGVNFYIRDNDVDRFTFNRTTGDFTATGDVAAYSDKRLKYEIEEIENALEKVKALTGVTFAKFGEDKRKTGLIAQDVEQVLPEAVNRDDKGYLSLSYGNLVGLLVEAIKELAEEVKNANSTRGCNCSETGGCNRATEV